MRILRYLIVFAINAVAVYLTALLLSGVQVDGFLNLLIATAVISFINTFLKPVLVILTLPFSILTLGLFILVINGGLILLADYLLAGFSVDNFWWALLFSFVIAIIGGLLGIFLKPKKRSRKL